MSTTRFDAVIFDFDGLILDTESTAYWSWVQIFQSFGVELPLQPWVDRIGSDTGINPFDLLVQATGRQDLSEVELRKTRSALRDEMVESLSPREGVMNWILDAKLAGMQVAIASSSESEWVQGHLERLEIHHHFDHIVTREDAARAKPAPDLFLEALGRLDTPPGAAVAIEDSPKGAIAALAAEIATVIVPGPMTEGLEFPQDVTRVGSFLEQTLTEVIARSRPS